MSLPIKTSRTMQLVTVAMLMTSLAQLFYWLYDEAMYTNEVLQYKTAQFSLHEQVAQRLVADGYDVADVQGMFPDIQRSGDELRVDPATTEALAKARFHRLMRYGSEGTFLLLVLAGGIATLSYTLRQPAELLRRQSNFIAAVSHEFKTPLASLRLSCETFLMRDVNRDNQRKLAQRMLEDTERLESMVTNILETGRMDEGSLHLTAEETPLTPVLEPIFHKFKQRGDANHVELVLDLQPELMVYCDPVALTTVIDNLLGNALQAVAQTDQGKIVLWARQSDGEAHIEVQDNGVGFDPSESRKLFEKFYRPGDELRRESKGSGLGLYIVQTVVQQSGGRVLAKSAGPGQGATFSLWLPRHAGART